MAGTSPAMTKPIHFQNHAPSRKRVPNQPEAGNIHHINGVFATDMMAPARVGGLTRICLKKRGGRKGYYQGY